MFRTAFPSADEWRSVLEPVVARYRHRAGKFTRYFRGYAGFASPNVYEFIEAEGSLYSIRLPANEVLRREIARVLTRPVARPPREAIIFVYGLRVPVRQMEYALRNGYLEHYSDKKVFLS